MQGGVESWFNFFLTTQLQLNISLFKINIQYINYCQELLLAPFTVIAPQYKCIWSERRDRIISSVTTGKKWFMEMLLIATDITFKHNLKKLSLPFESTFS